MKTLIKLLKIGIVLVGVGLTIASFIPGTQFTKVWSYLATIALPFAVDILRLTKIKVSEQFELAYLIFIIPAMVLGIDFDIYKVFYPLDKIVHTGSGILTAYGAKEVLDQGGSKRDKFWFRILFTFCFVMMVAAVWECFEFACDQIAGTHMQQLIKEGVEDTMYDMIVALIGGVIGILAIFIPEKR